MNMSNVFWISGNSHDKRKHLFELKQHFADGEILEIDESVSYTFLEEQTLSNSCFTEKKLVIIKALPKPTGTKPTMLKHLMKLLENLPKQTAVAFYGIEPSEEEALFKQVSKIAKVDAYPYKLNEEDAINWIVHVFDEDYGKTIDEPTAKTLVQTSGFDKSKSGIMADQLRLAIRKISDFVGKRKTITNDDILVNSFGTDELVIWKIFDAMDKKNLGVCMETAIKFCHQQNDVVSGVIQLFNVMLWRYRGLFFLKEGLQKKLSKDEVAKQIGLLSKMASEGTQSHMVMKSDVNESGANKGLPKQAYTDYFVKGSLFGNFGNKAIVDLYGRKDLFRIINCIQDAVMQLRMRDLDSEKMLLLDTVFYTVCNAVEDSLLTMVRSYD